MNKDPFDFLDSEHQASSSDGNSTDAPLEIRAKVLPVMMDYLFEREHLDLGQEKEPIKKLLFEELFGLDRNYYHRNDALYFDRAEFALQLKRFLEVVAELKANIPIQYILKSAWFYGRKFELNYGATLIPRNETEELVHWVLSMEGLLPNLQVLDLGTGSGCIPITIALEQAPKNWQVSGIDISVEALEVARKNAYNLHAPVQFIQGDIFVGPQPKESSINAPYLDILISNPPYVTYKEALEMDDKVLKHEPHLALFVENTEPLAFYEAIAEHWLPLLKTGGKLYVELNEAYGEATLSLFESYGMRCELRRDLNDKVRMLRGVKE